MLTLLAAIGDGEKASLILLHQLISLSLDAISGISPCISHDRTSKVRGHTR